MANIKLVGNGRKKTTIQVGCTAWLVLSDSSRIAGVVREVSPRRLRVWFGHTGMGQRVWTFTTHGIAIGSLPKRAEGGILDATNCGAVGGCSHCGKTEPAIDRVVTDANGNTVTYYAVTPELQER